MKLQEKTQVYRRELVRNQSARLVSGYIYADAGEGESSTDLVFAGHNIISENGTILKETSRFHNDMIISELDLKKLISERRRMSTYETILPKDAGYLILPFHFHHVGTTNLTRTFTQTPFVPQNKADRDRRCNEILNIQALGLKKRLAHTHCTSAVVGI